ncbi:MAG: helix-turn-helix domain-containing protein [Sphingobacterium composti]
MDITKKVKRLMLEEDMNATQFAKKIGMTQSNLSKKMNSGNYSVADLIQIAEASGVTLEINFVLEDGTKI